MGKRSSVQTDFGQLSFENGLDQVDPFEDLTSFDGPRLPDATEADRSPCHVEHVTLGLPSEHHRLRSETE
jgi:hypothetical protein